MQFKFVSFKGQLQYVEFYIGFFLFTSFILFCIFLGNFTILVHNTYLFNTKIDVTTIRNRLEITITQTNQKTILSDHSRNQLVVLQAIFLFLLDTWLNHTSQLPYSCTHPCDCGSPMSYDSLQLCVPLPGLGDEILPQVIVHSPSECTGL